MKIRAVQPITETDPMINGTVPALEGDRELTGPMCGQRPKPGTKAAKAADKRWAWLRQALRSSKARKKPVPVTLAGPQLSNKP